MFMNFPDITNSQAGSLWEMMVDRYLLTADNMSHDEISDEEIILPYPSSYCLCDQLASHSVLGLYCEVLPLDFNVGQTCNLQP